MRFLEKVRTGETFFFSTRPSAPERTLCILCVRRCNEFRSLSKDHKRNISAKTHLSLFLPAQLRCAVETEATEQGQSGCCSFNTQLKAHVFSKLVVCGYCSFNNMLAGNQI